MADEEVKMVEAEEREKTREKEKKPATMPERLEEMKSTFNTIIYRLQDVITTSHPHIATAVETAASQMESTLHDFNMALFHYDIKRDVEHQDPEGGAWYYGKDTDNNVQQTTATAAPSPVMKSMVDDMDDVHQGL